MDDDTAGWIALFAVVCGGLAVISVLGLFVALLAGWL